MSLCCLCAALCSSAQSANIAALDLIFLLLFYLWSWDCKRVGMSHLPLFKPKIMFPGLPYIYIGPDKERSFLQPSGWGLGHLGAALERDMSSVACQLPVRYKNSVWKEAGPYSCYCSLDFVLSEDTTHSLFTDIRKIGGKNKIIVITLLLIKMERLMHLRYYWSSPRILVCLY